MFVRVYNSMHPRAAHPAQPPHSAFPCGRRGHRYSPSGRFWFFLYITFSLAFLKSSPVTFIRRSRSASRPASVHTA
jgi:hypothetical protein